MRLNQQSRDYAATCERMSERDRCESWILAAKNLATLVKERRYKPARELAEKILAHGTWERKGPVELPRREAVA